MLFLKASVCKEVKAELEARLFAYARKPIGVVVPTTSEMAAVAKARFPRRNATAPSQSSSMKPPPPDALDHVVGKNDEEMRLGAHEIFDLLRKRHGGVETENSGCQDRHCAQHETVIS